MHVRTQGEEAGWWHREGWGKCGKLICHGRMYRYNRVIMGNNYGICREHADESRRHWKGA